LPHSPHQVTQLGIPVGKSAKLNQLCFRRLQCQAELCQAFTLHILKADGVLTVLETHHKVINIAHQIGFALQPWFDYLLKQSLKDMRYFAQKYQTRDESMAQPIVRTAGHCIARDQAYF
jgi:hypothetical protein